MLSFFILITVMHVAKVKSGKDVSFPKPEDKEKNKYNSSFSLPIKSIKGECQSITK